MRKRTYIYFLEFNDNYAFDRYMRLFNVKLDKQIKKVVNCRSIGWWVGKKFYTENKIHENIISADEYYKNKEADGNSAI